MVVNCEVTVKGIAFVVGIGDAISDLAAIVCLT